MGEAASSYHEEEPIDMTRQFSPEEVAELQARIEAANKELLEAEQAAEESAETEVEVQPVVETSVEPTHEEEPQDDANTQQESVLIL